MIPQELAQKVLAEALKTGADLAEIYVEDTKTLRISLDDTRIEEAKRGEDRGVGVRVFFGNLVTYAYTDSLTEASILDAARAAASAGKSSVKIQVIDLTERKNPLDFYVKKDFSMMSIQDKANLLLAIDEAARSESQLIVQVSGSYAEKQRKVWIFNSDGVYAHDERNFTEFVINTVAQRDGLLQYGRERIGAHAGLEVIDQYDPINKAKEAAQGAVRLLDAKPAPAGEFTVVMPNGWGGVLFHEACGHQMEADFVVKGGSAYSNKVGEQVAAPIITAIDDGTIPGQRGSLRFDDEGTPSQKTILIEKGILKEYMWDLTEARRAGREASTGNGRRETYRHMPMPRMTNTYIDAGEHDPQEIIESTKKGVYVAAMGGGQANIAKGDFVFQASEAYMIEDGKLTTPLRGATIAGNGPEVLMSIDMLGNDLELDHGAGHCGKGQWAKVSLGQPTLRIPKVTVGGTGE